MLDDRDTLRLIEGHLEGTLSADEEMLFEELRRTDAQFAASVKFQQKLMRSIDRLGDQLFLRKLQNLEIQIQTERVTKNKLADSLKGLTDKALEKGNILFDNLTAAFLPLLQYELAIQSASRSQTLEVSAPENGLDVKGGILAFELRKGINQSLQLSIETNQQQVIFEEMIEPQIIRFEISVKELEVGRYYWKLKTPDDLVMGSFFIRKDLMPS